MSTPTSIRHDHSLKTLFAILMVASTAMFSGCWVSSVHGLDEDTLFRPDPDITFDDSLNGTWHVTKDNCTTTLTVSGSNRTYDLELISQGDKCNDADNKAHYLAKFVKLDNRFFFDVYPMPSDVCDMCLALHWTFLVKFDKNTLTVTPIDSEWLKQASAQKTLTLTTLPDDAETITSSPKDLKAFCRKYADSDEVFKPDASLRFNRK